MTNRHGQSGYQPGIENRVSKFDWIEKRGVQILSAIFQQIAYYAFNKNIFAIFFLMGCKMFFLVLKIYRPYM